MSTVTDIVRIILEPVAEGCYRYMLSTDGISAQKALRLEEKGYVVPSGIEEYSMTFDECKYPDEARALIEEVEKQPILIVSSPQITHSVVRYLLKKDVIPYKLSETDKTKIKQLKEKEAKKKIIDATAFPAIKTLVDKYGFDITPKYPRPGVCGTYNIRMEAYYVYGRADKLKIPGVQEIINILKGFNLKYNIPTTAGDLIRFSYKPYNKEAECEPEM